MERSWPPRWTAPPELLLHACCAPCSSATLERLSAHFDLTILYYNPNIYPPEEYHRREAELERFVEQAGYHYPVVELPYDPQEFYTAVKGLENEPEKGARCTVCYRLRLEQAARYAADHGFDWYCTTLSTLPDEDRAAERAWHRAGQQYGVPFLPSEFRKKDGYKRSLQLSASTACTGRITAGASSARRPEGLRNNPLSHCCAMPAPPKGRAFSTSQRLFSLLKREYQTVLAHKAPPFGGAGAIAPERFIPPAI